MIIAIQAGSRDWDPQQTRLAAWIAFSGLGDDVSFTYMHQPNTMMDTVLDVARLKSDNVTEVTVDFKGLGASALEFSVGNMVREADFVAVFASEEEVSYTDTIVKSAAEFAGTPIIQVEVQYEGIEVT